MHQSWRFSIQCRYVEIQLAGNEADASGVADRGRDARVADGVEAQLLDRLARPQRMRRGRGVRIAHEPLVGQHRLDDFAGPSAARHDHPVRLLRDDEPAACRSATTALRARDSGRGRELAGAFSLSVPSRLKIDIIGSLCRWPTA